MTGLNVARFRFQGSIRGDDVSRETYAREIRLAREAANDDPDPESAIRLRAYAASMRQIYTRLDWPAPIPKEGK